MHVAMSSTSSMSAAAVAAVARGTAAMKALPRAPSRNASNRCFSSLPTKKTTVAIRANELSRKIRNANSFVARAAAAAAADGAGDSIPLSLADAKAVPVSGGGDATAQLPPTAPCVYAVLDGSGNVQYVGMSRRLPATVAGHAASVELAAAGKVSSVKFAALPAAATREQLTEAWRAWVQEVVDTSGAPPPGNLPDQQPLWAPRARGGAPPPPPEIRLTPGKGIEDLTVPLDTLISQVVADHHVVAFIKGTRREPQCGFSHSVLTMLTAACSAAGGSGAEATTFQVVNVLDEQYNPGLREAIKQFSAWPTIPQTFIGGEFVGGADIVAELASSGELVELIKNKKKK